MQKQFLWRRQLKDDPSRHKMTPSLIFSPRNAAGLGLIAIPVAIQAQRVKLAMLWLVGKQDIYREAWFLWMGIQGEEPAVSPRAKKTHRCPKEWSNRRRLLQTELGAVLAPKPKEQEARGTLATKWIPRLAAQAAMDKRSATRQPKSGEELVVDIDLNLVQPRNLEVPAIQAIWGSFTWADNPWIPDSNASILSRSKYNRIGITSIERLEITRIAETGYSVRIPVAQGFEEGHTVAKLERWLIAILLNSPRIKVGDQLGRHPPLLLRNPPQLQRECTWNVVAGMCIIGTSADGTSSITLQQTEGGLYWTVMLQQNAKKDAKRLFKHSGGIVFRANPQIHGFPWQVSARTRNKAILTEMKPRPRKQLQKEASPKLNQVLAKWTSQGINDEWVQGHQSQTPSHLWEHRNLLTNYQVWVTYRMATQQLNLRYEGELPTDGCLQAQDSNGQKITTTHIAWICVRAQQFWMKCLQHWLGHEVSRQCLNQYKSYFAARTAPAVGNRLRQRLTEMYGRWSIEYEDTLRRMWWAFCSIGYALLWQIRNQVVHQGKTWRAPQQLEYMWNSCTRQLYAVARRERSRPSTREAGLRLQLSLDCFIAMGAEEAPAGQPPKPAKWVKKPEQALIKRLRKFQEAIN